MVNLIDNVSECDESEHRWFVIAILEGIVHLICLVCRKREDRKV